MHAARVGEESNVYTPLMWRPEGRRPLGKVRSRWEDNIKRYVKETEWEGVEGITVAQWTSGELL